jgi:N utilization substance protein A
VREVLVDDETKEATVIVPDDQLSLAIGREGQNARLAAKLTGWKVDIKSQTEFSEVEEIEYEEEEQADGRCAAVLSAGRRCPNAALDGSRYCGLPQHQALTRLSTNQVTVLAPLSDEEVAVLAYPDAADDQVGPLVQRAEAAFAAEPEPEAEAETETPAPPAEPEAPTAPPVEEPQEPTEPGQPTEPEEQPTEPAQAEEPAEQPGEAEAAVDGGAPDEEPAAEEPADERAEAQS